MAAGGGPQFGAGQNAGGGGARERGQRRNREVGEDGPPPVAKRTVYVLINGEPQPREITTGLSDGRITEVTGGELKEGEQVITGVAGQNRQGGQAPRGPRIL